MIVNMLELAAAASAEEGAGGRHAPRRGSYYLFYSGAAVCLLELRCFSLYLFAGDAERDEKDKIPISPCGIASVGHGVKVKREVFQPWRWGFRRISGLLSRSG